MHKETQYDEVFDAQRDYRLLLDCMARPGKVNSIPKPVWSAPEDLHTATALVAFALLNADVSFCITGPNADTLTPYIQINTGARTDTVENADFIFIPGVGSGAALASAKKGTLPYPEEGATMVVGVGALLAEPPSGDAALVLTLQGPGVDGTRTLGVSGLDPVLLEMRQECNEEFPIGVDLILCDPEQQIACIPRSTAVQWGNA
jgi:alpha-D-ribose 1-methylphosphonate 5-triphosphate synthase subunit PhnH